MPWAKYELIPPALKTAGLTLPQANEWAKYFDQGKSAGMKEPAGFAWNRFKEEYTKTKDGDTWKKKNKPVEKSEITIPYILKDEAILREGEANGIFYSAEEIKLAIPYLNEEINEKDDAEVRHKNSVFCDHDDLEEGTWKWVGHFENTRWDEGSKLARADVFIADERIAKLIDYQKQQGIIRFGISPRLAIKENDAKASNIEFKGISLVIFPAGGPQLMLEKDGGFKGETQFFKRDDDERIVYGVVLEPNYVDSQGDWFDEHEIKNAMYKFMDDFQILTVQHQDRFGKQTPVMSNDMTKDWNGYWNLNIRECYQAPCDFQMNGTMVKKGSWVMATYVHDDDVWKMVKSGDITGYSIGGLAL